jgi:hypothetical protein
MPKFFSPSLGMNRCFVRAYLPTHGRVSLMAAKRAHMGQTSFGTDSPGFNSLSLPAADGCLP